MPLRHLLAVLLTALAAAAPAHADLLVNGSFESPAGCAVNCVLPGGDTSITGWTTLLSGVEHVNTLAMGAGAAPEGLMAVDLANFTFPEGGGIEQTLATVPGQTYTLSFTLGNSRFDGRDGTGAVRVQVAGLDQIYNTPQATSGTGVWQSFSTDFVAVGTQSTLRFLNDQNPLLHYAVIDQVSVVSAVPLPPTGWLALAGLVMVLLQARRRHRDR